MNVRKFLAVFGLSVGIVLISAPAARATVDHCPNHTEYPKLSNLPGDYVYAAGVEICVKASTGNTGRLVTDGTTSLRDYLKDAGIVGGDGEGRDPSHVVVYGPFGEITPTTTTSTTAPPPVIEEPTTTTSSTTTTTTTVVIREAPPVIPDEPVVNNVTPHLGCVTPDGFPYITNIEQGGCPGPVEPTVAELNDVKALELPRTGVSPTALLFVGLALAGLGTALRFAAKR